MTTRDYILLGYAFNSCKPKESGEALGMWRILLERISERCEIQNYRFDGEKFRAMCEAPREEEEKS